jgi:colanic acid biosynthesis glycosyl transferase WcaI
MGAKQDLLNVVDAAAGLNGEPRFKLALVGDGTERVMIEAYIARRRLANIKVLPLQSSQDFPRVLAAADVLLLNQAPLVMDSVLPSKLLTYMAAEKPVLAAVHPQSTSADLVRRASCGVVAAAGQPVALAESIRSMAASNENLDMSGMGKRGREYVTKHFERASILKRWDELLISLGGPTRPNGAHSAR